MMAKQRPPKDKINATSQDAAVRKKDTAIAARTFKFLPYSIFAFQCIGEQEPVAVLGGRRVAFFSLVRLSCRARGAMTML